MTEYEKVDLPMECGPYIVAALRNREQLCTELDDDSPELIVLRGQLRAKLANLGAELAKPHMILGVLAELLTGIERLSMAIEDAEALMDDERRAA